MEGKPLVSIVLPTFNGEKFLIHALESILAQTYQNWELIIVNDCSTDSTNEIAGMYAQRDDRIKVHRNEQNQKVAGSLNIGFSFAKGKYYTWTSDDNYYYPQALEKMVHFLENNPEYGMVYAISDKINEKSEIIGKWGHEKPTLEKLFDWAICGACFLYTADVAKQVGGYRSGLDLIEDHDYWLRILLVSKIGSIPEHLYAYRKHSGSLTGQNANIGRIKDYDLMFTYEKPFIEKYPELKTYIDTFQKARKYLRTKENVSIKVLLQCLSKKDLYKELKNFYRYCNDIFYLKYIFQMGIVYFIKGICLYWRYRKDKPSFYEFNIRRYGDSRGQLTTIENSEIPFSIKRVYYLSDLDSEKDRAHHAHKFSRRVLSAIKGTCRVILDDGKIKREYKLNTPLKAVFFDKKVWCELTDFSEDAVILALSDKPYFEEDYIRNYDKYLELIGR